MTNFLKTKVKVNYIDQTYDEFVKNLEAENGEHKAEKPQKRTRTKKQ